MDAERLEVLIVEDDPADVRRILNELREAGFEPSWRQATTPAEFTEWFTPTLDVVLSAYTLAKIDPLWMLQVVRQSESGVPLIIVSGVIGDENAAACLVLGATDYVLKDRLARLGSAIHRAMDERKATAAKREAERVRWLTERAAEERERTVDELRERNEFKSRFLNMVAHDLNNVVTPMQLSLRGLRPTAAGGERPEHAQSVAMLERGMGRLLAFLADLLDAARLQSGQLSILAAPVDLVQRVAAAVDESRQAATEAGLRLETDLPPSLVVAGDAGRLDQVLSNLIGNAIKFTPSGGRVTVLLRPSEHGALLSVLDSGAGLDATELPRLFQPFSKLAPTQGRHTGTGLGLFICRGIVETHGGRIWVESAGHGKGSTFFVWLPTNAPDRKPSGAVGAASPSGGRQAVARQA